MQYLVEETAETVEAIESGDQDHLREELGDLLLQVIFHAEIASEKPRASRRGCRPGHRRQARSPGTRTSSPLTDVPADLNFTWEQRKAAEKGRTSVLQGIPEQLSALARANKIISRARSRRVRGRPARRADHRRAGGCSRCSRWLPGPTLRDRPRSGASRRGTRFGVRIRAAEVGGRGRTAGLANGRAILCTCPSPRSNGRPLRRIRPRTIRLRTTLRRTILPQNYPPQNYPPQGPQTAADPPQY